MSWFDEQLREREQSDNASLAEAVDSIAGAVMGERLKNALGQKEIAGSAIEEILKYFGYSRKNKEIPEGITALEEQVEYCMRPFGIKNRRITLAPGWYRHAVGPMLGTLSEDGSAVALIPGRLSGYRIVNIKNGKTIKLGRKTEGLIDKEALCFYEPLPQKALTVGDLLKFMFRQLSISDIILYLSLMLAASLLGLLSPMFTRWLFGDVLEAGQGSVLLALAVFMVSYSVADISFRAFRELISSRIGIKQDIAVQAAVMNRILSLPAGFFRNYSSGELAQRIAYVRQLCGTMFSNIGMTAISSLFSLIYIGQIFFFAPALVVPALIITVCTVIVSLVTTSLQMKVTRKRMEASAKTSGFTYATITGMQKIKLAGAEKRGFARWAREYSKEAASQYNPPLFLKLNAPIILFLSMIGTMVMYAVAIRNHVSVPDYYAFNTAYGMVSAAFMSVISIVANMAEIRPSLEMARPILETEPEVHEGKENIAGVSGEIELSHVTFRYGENLPDVLSDFSLKINPGEYLAVVGRTGCGKSTLVRLLLGFETPQKGIISYDGKDLSGIDPEALRRRIGVVMQDGKLFSGDIYSNIVITAPELGMEQAWEAAEVAAIAEDIRRMPMGMHTVVSEGQGGFSGGQKQRLMIARAVAPKPKILIFDEATSALDNITQKKVTEAIDSLHCTRIVIAHRLSTIRRADRIIFLGDGKVLENGTYEELIAAGGEFAKLVERQRLDIETEDGI